MTTAFNIFRRQAVHQQCIPFDAALEMLNYETLAAFEEVGYMKKVPTRGITYAAIDMMG